MKKRCLACGKKYNRYEKPNYENKYCSIVCQHRHKRIKEQQSGGKICKNCKTFKSLSSFYLRKELRSQNIYRSECKICEIQKAKLYIIKNPDRARITGRKRMATPKGQFNRYRDSARRFKKTFTLDLEYFEKNITLPCYYCGSKQTDAISMGIDRIDSKKGYSSENCVPCCKKCNLAKFTYSPKEFIGHIFKIANYQRGKNANHTKTD